VVLKIVDILFGRPLATEEEKAERIGPLKLVESHWYHYLLHNNRREAIRALLLFNANQRITDGSIPYHLRA
jgi:hypothetical protein